MLDPSGGLGTLALGLAAPAGAATEDPAAPTLTAVPAVEVVETVDGLHDAFNDQSHRSVAATIVLWLERLRAGDISRPIVRAVTR